MAICHFDLISDQGRHRFKLPHALHRHSNLKLRDGDEEGGREIYQRLRESAAASEGGTSICVETTGCMGRCKSASNVKLMPEKVTHHAVQPTDVESLIQGMVERP